MADIFGVPVVGMVEEEGAALGAALQAAWCVARRDGKRSARIGEFTQEVVAVKEETRCVPNRANVARYRKLQVLHDRLSASLRDVFPVQRSLAGG
jgi:xylulokinase